MSSFLWAHEPVNDVTQEVSCNSTTPVFIVLAICIIIALIILIVWIVNCCSKNSENAVDENADNSEDNVQVHKKSSTIWVFAVVLFFVAMGGMLAILIGMLPNGNSNTDGKSKLFERSANLNDIEIVVNNDFLLLSVTKGHLWSNALLFVGKVVWLQA